jgi:hypothetical protein
METYQSVFSRDLSVSFTHQFITTRMRETRLKNVLIWPAKRKCNEGNATEPSIWWLLPFQREIVALLLLYKVWYDKRCNKQAATQYSIHKLWVSHCYTYPHIVNYNYNLRDKKISGYTIFSYISVAF